MTLKPLLSLCLSCILAAAPIAGTYAQNYNLPNLGAAGGSALSPMQEHPVRVPAIPSSFSRFVILPSTRLRFLEVSLPFIQDLSLQHPAKASSLPFFLTKSDTLRSSIFPE